ncbi:MAG: hypothetical protein NUV56_02215 [Candidatus Uhrbacteria bacterium]|nr:hypothetical protein [Candidatus Uhrbacteria bacterium]
MPDTQSVSDVLALIADVNAKLKPLTEEKGDLVTQLGGIIRAKLQLAIDRVNADPDIAYRFGSFRLTVRNDAYVQLVLRELTKKSDGSDVPAEHFSSTGNSGLGRVYAIIREDVGWPLKREGEGEGFNINIANYYYEESEK